MLYFRSPYVVIGFVWALLYRYYSVRAHTDECGTHDSTFSLQRFFNEEREERRVFGDSVSNLSRSSLGEIFQRFFRFSQARERSLAESDEATGAYYQLKHIPVAFHVLPHDNGGSGKPSLTISQAEYSIATTNKLFTIYNKEMAVSESFASFQLDNITVHDDIAFDRIMDCSEIPRTTFGRLIMKSADWEFKMHVIVCESNKFSGRASFPYQYSPYDPMHNAILMDYRAFACRDDLNNFLCNTNSSDGSHTSHTRWWRARSAMIAHETGHLFGLQHTFSSDCWISQLFGGDGVSDTPYHTTSVSKSCPGLLPYDRDRELFNKRPNPVTVSTEPCDVTCGGEHCGACCDVDGDGVCPKYQSDNHLEIVSEDSFSFPKCCSDPRPIDSCPWSVGVDPLNNVMSYVPDECAQEFTIGQMAKMMVQIRQYKQIIYCNYATLKEAPFCDAVPCSDWATGPNCL